MKEKKANWFTRNSWWLFIVLLVIDIILFNFVWYNSRLIFIHGITWDTNAPLIIYMIAAIVFMLVTFFAMYFLIYLEDSLHDRNKRKMKFFENLLEKWNLKEEEIEKN
jgi:uncharacterized integral membrane protein